MAAKDERETEEKRLEKIEHYLILFRGKEYTKEQTAKKILSSILTMIATKGVSDG